MQIMWHRTLESSSLVDFADAAEIGPKSNQTGERFIFQGCTGELNALYDGHMQIIRNHLTAAGAPSCVGRGSDG
ncbi:hypothetical protein KIP88_06840 [Bradyrhizobium sp. SRL28]|uniref:hypothetical protein n=1 Tax=Bradyrhizobium sp. SRL28 TaxID=2836178 RepID=UPI001BDE9799|nr:hypothetical protein [Bradyrhizobium sp. SRL28]MBT1510214.1 hypothetical protein [Bradyrhizobium sp. SRL28]